VSVISPQGAARLVELTPLALRPSWMHAAWEFADDASRVATELTDASSRMLVKPGTFSGQGEATGLVRAAGEVGTGSVKRTIDLADTGLVSIRHAELVVPDAAQGRGFGRAFTDRAFARYALAGVDEVRLEAGKSMGQYAWAKQGFEQVVPASLTAAQAVHKRATDAANLVRLAHKQHRITAQQFAQLEPRLIRSDGSLPADPIRSFADVADTPWGREILEGRNWHGRRAVESGPWWSAGRDAGDGVAQLRSHADAVATSANGMLDSLPMELDPRRFGPRLEQATGLRVSADDTYTAVNLDRGESPAAMTLYRLGDGSAKVDLRLKAGTTEPLEGTVLTWAESDARDRLIAGARELGVLAPS
jgi:GNAT superfamily N-acetyltransferase